MYGLAILLIFIFWIVGVVTGIGAAIFFLELEDVYIFQPIQYFLAYVKNIAVFIPSEAARVWGRVLSTILEESKRV